MTSAPVHLTGPAEDTRRAYGPTLNALREAVGRSADLWRQIDKPDAPAPGLSWTAAETAAHVVGDLRDYTQALTRHANGYMTHANRPMESPSRLSAKVNARHLEEVPERSLHRLADMLELAADTYLNTAAAADLTAEIATPNGLVIGPSTMAALLLGEQLVHGLDIARTARISWTITAADALLVFPGALTVMPQYLRPRRAAGLHISFELRMRGGPGYRMAVDDGSSGHHRGARKGRLCHHRGSGRLPAAGLRQDLAAVARAAWAAAARRTQAVAGDEVREAALQPLARTVGAMTADERSREEPTSVVIVGSGFTGFDAPVIWPESSVDTKKTLHPSTSRSSRQSTTCCTHRCCPTWQAGWSTPDSSPYRWPTRCEAYRLFAAGSTASTSTATPSPSPTPKNAYAACLGIAWS